MFAEQDQAASQLSPLLQGIDPGHRIGALLLSLGKDTTGLGEVGGFDRALLDIGRGYFLETQGGRVDEAGQAHAAEGRPKQIRQPVARAMHLRAVG